MTSMKLFTEANRAELANRQAKLDYTIATERAKIKIAREDGHRATPVKFDSLLLLLDELETLRSLHSSCLTPVSQKLPDDEITVLVANPMSEDYAIAYLEARVWRYTENALIIPWTVTHWMHLPTA